MTVPTVRAIVTEAGRLQFEASARQTLDQWLATLRGRDVEVVVRRARSQRSLDQNAYVWGVAYPILAEALGYEPHEHEDLHYGLVAKWGGEHFDKRLGQMVPNRRSSSLTTVEFSDYMEWLVRFAAKECGGVVIPLPGESEAA